MPQAVTGKKQQQAENEASRMQRTARVLDDHPKKNAPKRVRDVEISVPIAYGTIAFWLGKKADEFHSHKWTVYIRSATNEDLGPVIKRVVFQLHPSFNNPTRVVEAAPFELSESGWGEFEIGMTIFFHTDAAEKPLEIFHHLKLYPDDETGPQSIKKPVVVEAYDEIVFAEPSEAFLSRVKNHPAVMVTGSLSPSNFVPSGPGVEGSSEKKKGDTKDHPLGQWFLKYSDADELAQLSAARQQVQNQISKVKAELNKLEAEAHLKASTNH